MLCIDSCFREIKKLSKSNSYSNIKKDICKQNIGDLVKKSVILYSEDNFKVFKCRISNSNNSKGKSGGYRLLVAQINNNYILLKIYHKTGPSGQENISENDLVNLIENINQETIFNLCD